MEIINLYTDLANHSDKDFGWEKGIQNAINHGYKKKWIDIPFTLKNPPFIARIFWRMASYPRAFSLLLRNSPYCKGLK